MQGYNSTIIAYGQTGSGKTYTMTGPDDNRQLQDCQGIIQRAIMQIFSLKRGNVGSSLVKITYIEIHNEQIRDLLNQDKKTANDIQINEQRGIINLKNVTYQEVQNSKEALYYLNEGIKQRQYGVHEMNNRSSRSHAIYTIWIQNIQQDGTVLNGKINLVDLAGSERQHKTLAEGQTAREASQINKSLTFLEQVVVALVNRHQHIPYRSSKLTYFLKDSIGGNCRTLLIACIWGDSTQVNESISTCRFAQRMMQVTENATINTVNKENGGLVGVHGSFVRLDPMVQRILEQMTQDAVQRERLRLQRKFNNVDISNTEDRNTSSKNKSTSTKFGKKMQLPEEDVNESMHRIQNYLQTQGHNLTDKEELIRLRQRVKDLEFMQNQNQSQQNSPQKYQSKQLNQDRQTVIKNEMMINRNQQLQKLGIEVPKINQPNHKSYQQGNSQNISNSRQFSSSQQQNQSQIQVEIQHLSQSNLEKDLYDSTSQLSLLQAKIIQLEKERNQQEKEMQYKISEMQRQKEADKQFCVDLKQQIEGMKQRMQNIQLHSAENQYKDSDLLALKTQMTQLYAQYQAYQQQCSDNQSNSNESSRNFQDMQLKQDLQNILARLDQNCNQNSTDLGCQLQEDSLSANGVRKNTHDQSQTFIDQQCSLNQDMKQNNNESKKQLIDVKSSRSSGQFKDTLNGKENNLKTIYKQSQGKSQVKNIAEKNNDQISNGKQKYGLQVKDKQNQGVMELKFQQGELINDRGDEIDGIQELDMDQGLSQILKKLKIIEQTSGSQYTNELEQIKNKLAEVQESILDEQQDCSSNLNKLYDKATKSQQVEKNNRQPTHVSDTNNRINYNGQKQNPDQSQVNQVVSPKSDISPPKTPISCFQNYSDHVLHSSKSQIQSQGNTIRPSSSVQQPNQSCGVSEQVNNSRSYSDNISKELIKGGNLQLGRQNGKALATDIINNHEMNEKDKEIKSLSQQLQNSNGAVKGNFKVPKLDLKAPNKVDLDLDRANIPWIQQILKASNDTDSGVQNNKNTYNEDQIMKSDSNDTHVSNQSQQNYFNQKDSSLQEDNHKEENVSQSNLNRSINQPQNFENANALLTQKQHLERISQQEHQTLQQKVKEVEDMLTKKQNQSLERNFDHCNKSQDQGITYTSTQQGLHQKQGREHKLDNQQQKGRYVQIDPPVSQQQHQLILLDKQLYNKEQGKQEKFEDLQQEIESSKKISMTDRKSELIYQRSQPAKVQQNQALHIKEQLTKSTDLSRSPKIQKGERVNFLETQWSSADNLKSSDRLSKYKNKVKQRNQDQEFQIVDGSVSQRESLVQQKHYLQDQQLQDNTGSSNKIQDPESNKANSNNYQQYYKQDQYENQQYQCNLSNRYKVSNDNDQQQSKTNKLDQQLKTYKKFGNNEGQSKGSFGDIKSQDDNNRGISYFDQSINLDLSQKPNTQRETNMNNSLVNEILEKNNKQNLPKVLISQQASGLERKSIDSSIQKVTHTLNELKQQNDRIRSQSAGLILKDSNEDYKSEDLQLLESNSGRKTRQSQRSFPKLNFQNKSATMGSHDYQSEAQLTAKSEAVPTPYLNSKTRFSQRFSQIFKTQKFKTKSVASQDSNQIQVEQSNQSQRQAEYESSDDDLDSEAPNIVILNSLTHEQLMELLRAHSMASENIHYDALQSKNSTLFSGQQVSQESLHNINSKVHLPYNQNKNSNLQIYGNLAQESGNVSRTNLGGSTNQRSTSFSPILRNQRSIFGRKKEQNLDSVKQKRRDKN